jgi:hypothetical protein
MGLPVDDPAAEAWRGIPGEESGLQAWAHRRHLGRRVIDPDFLRLWDSVQVFLDVVLARFEAESVRAFELVDRLLAVDPPTKAGIQSLMEDVAKAQPIVEHIARSAPLSWFPELVRAGFFEGVPEVHELGEGDSWENLRWPPVQLLRRAVGDPNMFGQAWDVIETVAGKSNPPLHIDLLEIALQAPPSEAIRMEPFVHTWVSGESGILLIDRVVRLAEHAASGGFEEVALKLSALVLGVDEDGNSSPAQA